MRLSEYFLPTIKENPNEAEIVSHQYMLRAGMIRQSSAGIYSWLPLGLKVLKKVEQIVREEQNKAGCLEVLMPTIQPASLWQESGRYDDYGLEMLRIKDRHDREMLYGPTNEELITEIFKSYIKSYKDLPKNLYHIQWKFRDEIRPRFGVMRGREFLMKDNYSFDIDFEGAQKSYENMYKAYTQTFKRMGLKSVAVKADSGAIGGDMSHEFQILASTGESEIYYDPKIDELPDGDPEIRNLYAAASEMYDESKCPIPREELKTARGIEVGHIFYFGTKYSSPLKAVVTNKQGELVPVEMGSYGIGVSRLVGAIIEASHDDKGIIWPKAVAPYDVGLINLKTNDEKCSSVCDELYQKLKSNNIDVLYDDRNIGAGAKFADMDLIGLPKQITIGPKSLAQGQLEVKDRATGDKHTVDINNALEFVTGD